MKFPETIWVRNNGTEAHRDRYDGEEFEIKPGESLQIHQGCAELCFGFGLDPSQKLPTLRRLGWVETSGDVAAGLARLNAFSFHESAQSAQDHSAPKPTAPAKGKVGVVAGGADAPPASLPPVNLLGKLAATMPSAA